jgi:hypothetical protein
VITCICRSERDALIASISSRMRCATSMVFAPVCLRMLMRIVGDPPIST